MGENKRLYCSVHKLDGMIDIKNKNCIHIGCNKRPSYNKKGEKSRLYCFEHKLDGMINIGSKICIHEGCKIYPLFNKNGEKIPLYCLEHKLEGMVDVINKKCIHPGCKTRPNFNKVGEKSKMYCFNHKLEGMVDVINKKCIHPMCKTRPNFNKEGEKIPLYCVLHKLDGMIDVINKKCIHPDCIIQPQFNKEGERAIFCALHKLEGMVDVRHKKCKSEWCSTRATGKYDGYCFYCYINLFPDKPASRNYKNKERAVIDYVKTNFNLPWVSDKVINGGCSRRRPDLLLDLIEQIIIVEVDENQHIDYDCSCENKRIMELSQDLEHRPIVFIRFNPDDYTKDGINVSSCWARNKNGICVVKKSKSNEWTNRLNSLGETIEYWLKNKTDKTIETIQLFYDS